MSITHTEITEAEFQEMFRPHADESATAGYVNYGYQTEAERRVAEQANAERRLWTFGYTGGGNPWITQGFAYVNREFYIICDVPVPEGVEYTVDMGESMFCEICGNWFADQCDGEDSVERSQSDTSECVRCLNDDWPDEED